MHQALLSWSVGDLVPSLAAVALWKRVNLVLGKGPSSSNSVIHLMLGNIFVGSQVNFIMCWSHSGFSSATKLDIYHKIPPEPLERHIREPPNMAAAALMNPAASYHAHNTPFSSPHHHHRPPPPPIPSLLSAGENRRISNESEPAQRQSLPSISEVFSAGKPTYSPTTPTTLPGPQSLPPPFSSSAPPRSEPGPEPRPAPSHEDGLFRYPRTEVAPPRPPTSAHPFSEPRDPRDPRDLGKAPESAQLNGSNHNPHPHPHVPYAQPGQLPPGQFPLSQAPISPRHLGPIPPYEQHRPPLHGDEEYGMHRGRYDPTNLNRQIEAWGYTDYLQRVRSMSMRNIDLLTNQCHRFHGGPGRYSTLPKPTRKLPGSNMAGIRSRSDCRQRGKLASC